MNSMLKLGAINFLYCFSVLCMEFPPQDDKIGLYKEYCRNSRYINWVKETSYKPGEQYDYEISRKMKIRLKNSALSNRTNTTQTYEYSSDGQE